MTSHIRANAYRSFPYTSMYNRSHRQILLLTLLPKAFDKSKLQQQIAISSSVIHSIDVTFCINKINTPLHIRTFIYVCMYMTRAYNLHTIYLLHICVYVQLSPLSKTNFPLM